MKVLHLYEVKLLDGSRFQGEIAYKDQEKLVLRLRHKFPQQKVRILNKGISSIQELGWKREYALR
ncbi:hypothetical protein AMJ52_03745 [candidate division TA06 bacterium DG_78]|uniref:Uncharacterized protein n=1 Tax=candidate division TA06 bacterium DG_78 TaxID=1703772 RepID=A0A0S7YF70_UNCT6|nr:MAG: hypothetical protein AMJ52_03745 [candidate division TA06 bacterium DG_78]